MSHALAKDEILWYQRLWASEDLYTGELDGYWGPNTEAANDAFTNQSRHYRELIGEFDTRTEKNLATLTVSAQHYARFMLRKLRYNDIYAKVISGTRTYEEQDAIYQIGRQPGDTRLKRTNARGGQSNHNFGCAWDIGIWIDGEYVGEDDGDERYYIEAASYLTDYTEGLDHPIRWGGHWNRFKDYPHYQLNTGVRATELAKWFEKGDLFGVLNVA